jgi:hypothetical protein
MWLGIFLPAAQAFIPHPRIQLRIAAEYYYEACRTFSSSTV